jgi:hypothetical protein
VVIGGFTPSTDTAKVRWAGKVAYARAWSGSTTTRFRASAWCRNAAGQRQWYYNSALAYINGPEVWHDCGLNISSGYSIALDNNWANLAVA